MNINSLFSLSLDLSIKTYFIFAPYRGVILSECVKYYIRVTTFHRAR